MAFAAPVPVNVSVWLPPAMLPSTCAVAVAEIVTVPWVPKAVPFSKTKMPALIVVPAVYVFDPDKIQVPRPCLRIAVASVAPLLMTPAIVFAPVFVPDTTRVTVPAVVFVLVTDPEITRISLAALLEMPKLPTALTFELIVSVWFVEVIEERRFIPPPLAKKKPLPPLVLKVKEPTPVSKSIVLRPRVAIVIVPPGLVLNVAVSPFPFGEVEPAAVPVVQSPVVVQLPPPVEPHVYNVALRPWTPLNDNKITSRRNLDCFMGEGF